MTHTAFHRLVARAGDMVDPTQTADGPPPEKLLPFMRWALRGGWFAIWIGVTISVLGGATEVLSMYFLGRVVDVVGEGGATNFLTNHLWLAIVAATLLIVVRPLLFGGLALTQSVMIGPNVFILILARLFRWTMGQSVTFFDNDFAGRLAQKKLQVARSLTEIVVETVNAITFGLASLVGTAVLLFEINIWLLLFLLGWLVLYFGFLRLMLPKIRTRAAARAEAQANVTGQVVDTISNIKTVKLFGGDRHEDRMAWGAMDVLRDRAIYFGEATTLFRLGLIFIAGLLPVGLVGIAVGLSHNGISAGDIAAVGAVSIRLAQMTGWISFTIMVIYGHVGEVEDGMQTLAPPDRLEDDPGAVPLKVSDGEIVFHDVSFAYGREGGGGLDHVALTVRPGEKIGIVGASGAGKSTLVSLLMRLYDPEAGRVEIDGQDLRDVSQESLRQQIGMVTQETSMFNRSARDNILYGRPDADENALEAASRGAEVHDFIDALEDNHGRAGYDAHLGERGVKLSGGQRQRIALARAILKDAPILVLDEATSALDSEVEAAIQATLETVMEGKTVLAIAHRLSTIARMDRIVVLDQGRIVEQGSHDELLASGGVYARFWERQSGGFIGVDTAAE